MDVLFLPELGQFALILALAMACVQALLPLVGSLTRQPLWLAYAQPAVWAQFALLTISFAFLTSSFLLDDFSVAYVANNSNSACPGTINSVPYGVLMKVHCFYGCGFWLAGVLLYP